MTAPVYAATHFSLPSGTRVLDRFTIQRGLGIGGFGEVYFALSDAGKEVALKRIQRNLEIELRGVSHCLNLKHPNLVSLYDVCRDDSDRWWIVMEYIAGPSLRDALDQAPLGLDQAEIERWFIAAARGVEHLHQEGLVHRDLKPANLFDDFGVVKVGDYGLSKYISESRRGGQTESVGTFHYMAPEVGRGEYGREIDLYALGVILYEMLTGRLPFEGETCQEIIIKHLSAQPELSGIAEPYRSVIDKALRKDPRQRWSSAGEMLQALNLVGVQPSACPAAAGVQASACPAPVGVQVSACADPRVSRLRSSAAFVTGDAPIRASLVSHAAPSPPAAPGSPSALSRGAFATCDAGTLVPSPQEPLAQAIGFAWRDFRRWWHDMQLSPGMRLLVTVLVGFILLRNLRWILPVLSVIGFVYVPYYVIRQMLLARHRHRYGDQWRSRSTGITTADAVGPGHRRPVRLTRANWRQMQRARLASKRASTQLAELTGSWLAAAIAAVFCGIAAAVIGLRHREADPILIAPYVWTVFIGFIVAVVILGFGKLWEARDGDPLNRRLVLAGSGGLLGGLAYVTAEHLMIPMNQGLTRTIDATGLPNALYNAAGTPLAAAIMTHFALLLAGVRWWKLTDPLRSRRLSLWAVAVVVVMDWLIQQIVPIPQPWGMLIAGSAVIAIQIAASWESPEAAQAVLNQSGQLT